MTDTRDVAAAAGPLNMSELAHVLGLSLPTLRGYLQKHPDFPVCHRGDKGEAYEFDFEEVRDWLARHEAAKAEAEAERRAQLDLLAAEVYGERLAEETSARVTPEERKKLAEAIYWEDRNREKRGELLQRGAVSHALQQAFSKLRKGLRQIPQDIARSHGLDRAARLSLENAIRQRVNETVEDLIGLLGDEAGESDDAQRSSA